MTTKANWKLSYIGSALVFSSGLVFYNNKKPRGLSYDDVVKMLREHPRVGYYEKKIQRTVTLGDALAGNLDDLGKTVPMIASLDFFKAKHDRIFKTLPKNGEQLLSKIYESEPERRS